MRAGREYALKRALAKLDGDFDVVIIDCRPRWVCSRSTGSPQRTT